MTITRRSLSLFVLLATVLPFAARADDALNDPQRPLRAESLDSLVAATRIFGYVRHFNPAIESFNMEWSHFAANAALVMEDVVGVDARLDALSKLFGAIAPTVMIYPSAGASPEMELIRASPETPIVSIATWDHRGYGPIFNPGMFHSNRVGVMLEEGARLKSYPNPMEPYRADVGGGVSVSVPLSVWTNQDGNTLPIVSEATDRAMPRPLNSATPDELRRAVRLANVMLAWNVLRHFHPWADLSDDEWVDALRESLELAAVSPDDTPRGRARAVDLLLARIGDGQAHVIDPQSEPEYAPALAFEFVGDRLFVAGADGAAGRRDDAPTQGDEVVSVNGTPLRDALEGQTRHIGATNDALRRWMAFENIALGARESELTLGVRSEDARVRDVTLPRTEPPSALRRARPRLVHEPAPGVVYIDASRMDEDEVFEELQKHATARGIIFDYRGAADGALGAQLGVLLRTPEPIRYAEVWIPTPRRPDRVDLDFVLHPLLLISKPPELDARIVFLADGLTMGKAEADLVTVREANLGVIVGERTAGAPGANLSQEWLPSGVWLRWTGVGIRNGAGETFHGRGVEPDVEAPRTVRGVTEGRDEALERAVQLITG